MGIQLIQMFAAGMKDADGTNLAFGHVFTYMAGTTTYKAVFVDSGGADPAIQPFVLDSRGTALVYGSGNYRFQVCNSLDALITDIDNAGVGGVIVVPIPTRYVAVTPGQTVIPTPNYVPGADSLRVYFNGIRITLEAGDYVETDPTFITLAEGHQVFPGAEFLFEVW